MASDFRDLQIISVDSPVAVGDECQIWVEFEYTADDYVNKTLYAAIGKKGLLGFNEILFKSKVYELEPTWGSWLTFMGYVSIVITDALSISNSPFDVYAKVTDGTVLISPVAVGAVALEGGTVTNNWVLIDKQIRTAIWQTGEVTNNWVLIDKRPISILHGAQEEANNWILIDKQYRNITYSGTTPPPTEGTNWLPIVLIGGGAAIAMAAAIPKKALPKKRS